MLHIMDSYGALQIDKGSSTSFDDGRGKKSIFFVYSIGAGLSVLFISAGLACMRSNSFTKPKALNTPPPQSKFSLGSSYSGIPHLPDYTKPLWAEQQDGSTPEYRKVLTDDHGGSGGGDGGHGDDHGPDAAQDVMVVLGRPTCDSVTMKLMASHGATVNPVAVQYASEPLDSASNIQDWSPSDGSWDGHTPLSDSSPQTLELSGIFSPSSRVYYRVSYMGSGGQSQVSKEYSFSTCKQEGDPFKVLIVADSHYGDPSGWFEDRLDDSYSTMAGMIDQHDLLIDMGDTFMCEKVPEMCLKDLEGVHQWWFNTFSRLAPYTPLYLAPGNHDGLAGYIFKEPGKGDPDPMQVLEAKKRYFALPNPSKDSTFYTGNTDTSYATGNSGSPDDTYIQDYYAWTWGDALFIVLDPFWYTETSDSEDGWRYTLGADQQAWLVDLLKSSTATFKFVMMHNHLGGARITEVHMSGGDQVADSGVQPGYDGRGDCEWVPGFESGGKDQQGNYVFDKMRPNFIQASQGGGSLHEIMENYGVTAYFHAHDHLSSMCNLKYKEDSNGVWYVAVTKIDSPTTLTHYNHEESEESRLQDKPDGWLDKTPAQKGFSCKVDDSVIANAMTGWCDDGAGFLSLDIAKDQVNMNLVSLDGTVMHTTTFNSDGTATATTQVHEVTSG